MCQYVVVAILLIMNKEKFKRKYNDQLHAIIAIAQAELKRVDYPNVMPSSALRSHLFAAIEASVRFEVAMESLEGDA